jgi:hypothetical protein
MSAFVCGLDVHRDSTYAAIMSCDNEVEHQPWSSVSVSEHTSLCAYGSPAIDAQVNHLCNGALGIEG